MGYDYPSAVCNGYEPFHAGVERNSVRQTGTMALQATRQRPLRATLAGAVAIAAAWAGQPLAAPPLGIQGSDDRTAVEIDAYPWSSVGRLNNSGRGFCTAVLIAPNRVLTAAHCLRSHVPGRAWAPPSGVHFLAGYRRGAYVAHSRATAIALAPAAPGTAPTGSDFAIVTLAHPLDSRVRPLPVESFDQARWHADRKAGIHYAQAGYSGDRAHVLTQNKNCSITGFRQNGAAFAHTCDATHGDSGSPILVRRGQTYAVVGLHIASSRSGGNGVAIAGRSIRAVLDQLADPLQKPYRR